MLGLDQLSGAEYLLVVLLITLVFCDVAQALNSRSWLSVYRPTLFVDIILVYYCIAGPLIAIASHETIYRNLEHRSLLIWGWAGAVLFLCSILIGFSLGGPPKRPRRVALAVHPDKLHRLGVRVCQISLAMFGLITGTRLLAFLNPLATEAVLQSRFLRGGLNTGAIYNYFNYSINLLIPGLALMMAAWLRQRKHTASLLLWSLTSVAIYISLGFRYRLVLVAIPPLLLWFMARQRRPSMPIIALFLAGFIAFNGLIVQTRTYGRGLDLESIEEQEVSSFFDSGLAESVVFFSSSGVIQQTPESYDYVGAAPIVNTLAFPIPRAWYPSKPSFEYIQDVLILLYGSETAAKGAAILSYAEYYLIAGWPSLIVISLFLGWLLRQLWNWFLVRHNEPMAQVVYLLSCTFLYVAISRGYLPQVALLFVFTLAPLYWLYGRWSSPIVLKHRHASPTSLPRS